MTCERRNRAPMQRCAHACARITKPTARSSILVNSVNYVWGIMIPLCSAARTQDVVLDRFKAVQKAVPQNGPDAKTLKSKHVFAWFGSSWGHQTGPDAADAEHVKHFRQKAPDRGFGGRVWTPPSTDRRRCKCNDLPTHPHPHTPRPLLTEI